MKPFNLAEMKIAERAYCRTLLLRRIRVIGLVVIAALAVAAVSSGGRMSVCNEQTQLKSQLADVQGHCVRIKHEIAEVKARASRRKWQTQLAGESRRWLRIMESILARVPSDVWLNRMENSEQNSSVTVEGQAASFDTLSGFIGSLKSNPRITDVMISNTRVSSQRGVTVVDFALQLKLKAPPGSTTAGAAPAAGGAQGGAPAPASEGVPAVQESG